MIHPGSHSIFKEESWPRTPKPEHLCDVTLFSEQHHPGFKIHLSRLQGMYLITAHLRQQIFHTQQFSQPVNFHHLLLSDFWQLIHHVPLMRLPNSSTSTRFPTHFQNSLPCWAQDGVRRGGSTKETKTWFLAWSLERKTKCLY